MSRWAVTLFGCIVALGVGYVIFLQTDFQLSPKDALSKLHLPLERTDYFQHSEQMASLQEATYIKSPEAARTSDEAQISHAAAITVAAQQPSPQLAGPPQLEWRFTQTSASKQALVEPHTQQLNMIKDIQRELTRAGCGDIRITGKWDNRTKAALYNFVKNSNASLPIARPDIVLLSLVQNYKESKCGLSCIGPSCSQNRQAASPATGTGSLLKSADKSGSSTIVSGWEPEIERSSNSNTADAATADPQKKQPNDNPVVRSTFANQLKPKQTTGYKRIDTASFGGTRMSLGAPLPNPINEPGSENTSSGSIETFSETQSYTNKPVAQRQNASTKRSRPPRRQNSDWRTRVFTPD